MILYFFINILVILVFIVMHWLLFRQYSFPKKNQPIKLWFLLVSFLAKNFVSIFISISFYCCTCRLYMWFDDKSMQLELLLWFWLQWNRQISILLMFARKYQVKLLIFFVFFSFSSICLILLVWAICVKLLHSKITSFILILFLGH